MSSAYGLAADQVLEWEVITADGRHLVASPTDHHELYWALAGGGGGTFAVVICVTVRAFPDNEVVGGASLVIERGLQPSTDAYWAAVGAWQEILPALLGKGATAGYAVTRDAFFVQPITILGAGSESEMRVILHPFVARLDEMNVKYQLRTTAFASFYEHYQTYQGPLPWGPYVVNLLFGGRMISRHALETRPSELLATVRHIVEDTQAFLGFVALDVNPMRADGGLRAAPISTNAVLPSWRRAALTVLAQSTWNLSAPRRDGLRRSREMTEAVVPALANLTKGEPAMGTYSEYRLRIF